MYDYEPSIAENALNASIARLNSRLQGRNLFGVIRSYVRRVSVELAKIYFSEMSLMDNTFSTRKIFLLIEVFWFSTKLLIFVMLLECNFFEKPKLCQTCNKKKLKSGWGSSFLEK